MTLKLAASEAQSQIPVHWLPQVHRMVEFSVIFLGFCTTHLSAAPVAEWPVKVLPAGFSAGIMSNPERHKEVFVYSSFLPYVFLALLESAATTGSSGPRPRDFVLWDL
jgi:hypothetical protein